MDPLVTTYGMNSVTAGQIEDVRGPARHISSFLCVCMFQKVGMFSTVTFMWPAPSQAGIRSFKLLWSISRPFKNYYPLELLFFFQRFIVEIQKSVLTTVLMTGTTPVNIMQSMAPFLYPSCGNNTLHIASPYKQPRTTISLLFYSLKRFSLELLILLTLSPCPADAGPDRLVSTPHESFK